MNLKGKFNLSHVAGFFVGVVVTVAFNWIVFKDPKRVTAPGLAALVAMCTFTLALWSAFKVSQWTNAKINESGYKHSEKIIEQIHLITASLITVNSSLLMIDPRLDDYQTTNLDLIRFHRKKLSEENEELSLLVMKLNILTLTLPQWGVAISESHGDDIDTLVLNVIELNQYIRGMFYYDNNDKKQLFKYIDNIKVKIKLIASHLDNITKSGYDEIFTFNTFTSPLKKAD